MLLQLRSTYYSDGYTCLGKLSEWSVKDISSYVGVYHDYKLDAVNEKGKVVYSSRERKTIGGTDIWFAPEWRWIGKKEQEMLMTVVRRWHKAENIPIVEATQIVFGRNIINH